MYKLRNGNQGDSNPGSLDSESPPDNVPGNSGMLPLEYFEELICIGYDRILSERWPWLTGILLYTCRQT